MKKAFEPSDEWVANEHRARKRWRDNEKIVSLLKYMLYGIAIAGVFVLLVHTLVSVYYIAMYFFKVAGA